MTARTPDAAVTTANGETVGVHRTAVHLAPDQLPAHATALFDRGFRLALVAGHDDGPDGLRAVYLFVAGDPDRRVELQVRMPASDPHLPSLAALSFPAGRFEREMRDLFGIIPDNHPLPRRLVRHFHWPRGWYPMRRAAVRPADFTGVEGSYPFRTVEGTGVYEIPVGPVHAGMIEPGHFRFSVVGETILNLKARLWFVHRGIEKQFQQRTVADGLVVAERISGDTSVGHALAYSLAAEDALGLTVPEPDHRLRSMLLELERLYNHAGDIGALCNDVGYGILNAHALRIRESLQRVSDRVTGSRLLRGAVFPGGARVRSLPDDRELAAIDEDLAEVVGLALRHSVVRDRFTGTAVLRGQQIVDLGVLGYVARAGGVDVDARRDHPVLVGEPVPEPGVATTGDVLARFSVRAAEFRASVKHLRALIEDLDGYLGSAGAAAHSDPPVASGVGLVEGWRGTIAHRIEVDHSGRLTRVKVVDPSFFNWPALPVALADTIVPDFPLVNKSFNLSYAGNDL